MRIVEVVCKVGKREIRIYIGTQSTLTLNGRSEVREKENRGDVE